MKDVTKTYYAEIEKVAFTLKFAVLNDVKRDALERSLAPLILKALHLPEFAGMGEVKDTLLEDGRGYDRYSSDAFPKAYNYAREAYGKLDEKTGKLIPFMQLFNYAYNLKASDILREKIKERDFANHGVKEVKMRSLLNKVTKRQAEPIELGRINVMNLESVKAQLKQMSAEEQDFAEAEQIMSTNYVESDTAVNENGENIAGVVSDRMALQDYERTDRNALLIADRMESVLAAIKSPNLKKYASYYLTINVNGFGLSASSRFYLRHLMDKDLEDYMNYEAGCEDSTTMLANYLGLERETVRKNLKKVEAYFKLNKEMAS